MHYLHKVMILVGSRAFLLQALGVISSLLSQNKSIKRSRGGILGDLLFPRGHMFCSTGHRLLLMSLFHLQHLLLQNSNHLHWILVILLSSLHRVAQVPCGHHWDVTFSLFGPHGGCKIVSIVGSRSIGLHAKLQTNSYLTIQVFFTFLF